MADFCKECSIELFGEDFQDLAGITKKKDFANGLRAIVICEGCGLIGVDPDGKRVGPKETASKGTKQ
jgi:hypothetical protein